jgi:cytochrome c oxidase accessory protein FixG
MSQVKSSPAIRPFRWITEILQAVLILGIPFIRINGESAFRFDLPTLRLHVFGCTLWMHEFFIVLVATIFFTLLIVFVTMMFGRVWCGWFCPQTVLIDFTPFMDRAAKKGLGYRAASYAGVFVVSVLIAASLIWYFISPYEFIPDLLKNNLGATTWGFWIVMTIVIFLNYALLRHKFCATVCPYAKLQSVMFDKSTLIIEMDPKRADECIECSSCVRACPTGLDIRKGLDAACINCAECIDACSRIMGKLKKKGLIHYAFGAGGGAPLLRQNTYIVGAFLLAFFALYVHLSLARTGVDVAVLPHNMEARLTKDGRIINAYVLSLRNMRSEPIDLTVTVEKFDESMVQSQNEPLHLDAEKRDRFALFIRVNKPQGRKETRRIKIYLDDKAKQIHIEKEANFSYPDEL